jgi:hypothetical protein
MQPPSAASLQYPVAPSPAQQGAEAFARAPQENADKAQKLAESKAATATAANTTAEAPGKQEADIAENAAKKMTADSAIQTQAYANLYRVASMPNIANVPGGIKMLQEAADKAGIPIPKTINGLPDTESLKKLSAVPAKPWAQWTPAEKQASKALKPEERSLPDDAPATAKSDPVEVPVTQAGITALMKPVADAEKLIGQGKGNLQALQGAALSAYRSLKARGADTSVVDPYLNDNHTAINPEYVNQQVGAYVKSQMDKERALGIHYANEDKVAQEKVAQTKYQWEHPSANQRMQLDIAERRIQNQAQQAGVRTQLAIGNLNARVQSLHDAEARGNVQMAGAIATQATQALGGMQSRLTQTTNVISTMSQNPKLRNSPEYKNLVDQASDLQAAITNNGPTFQANADMARNQQAQTYAQIRGGQPNVTIQQAPINVNVTSPGAPQFQTYGGGFQIPKGAQTGTIHTSKGDVKGYTIDGKTFFDAKTGKPIT